MSKEKASHLIEAFLWRFLNTMKASWLPAMLLVLVSELEGAGDLTALADGDVWQRVLYAGLLALLTSIIAGLDKVQRENVRLDE